MKKSSVIPFLILTVCSCANVQTDNEQTNAPEKITLNEKKIEPEKTKAQQKKQPPVARDVNNIPPRILESLMKSHPDQSFVNDLEKRIKSGEVRLTYNRGRNPAHATAAVQAIGIIKGQLVKQLFVSPNALKDPNQTDQFLQLVIYHEFQHILHYDTGKLLLSDDLKIGSRGPRGFEYMNRWFMSEIDAYEKECKLAVKMGWEKEFKLCEIYAYGGRAMMQRAFANSTIHTGDWTQSDNKIVDQLGGPQPTHIPPHLM